MDLGHSEIATEIWHAYVLPSMPFAFEPIFPASRMYVSCHAFVGDLYLFFFPHSVVDGVHGMKGSDLGEHFSKALSTSFRLVIEVYRSVSKPGGRGKELLSTSLYLASPQN